MIFGSLTGYMTTTRSETIPTVAEIGVRNVIATSEGILARQ